jgi:hypothetical protein
MNPSGTIKSTTKNSFRITYSEYCRL